MNKLLLFFFFLNFYTSAFAYHFSYGITGEGNGKISGTVIDSATQKPVEFATVALMKTESNQPLDGAVCNDKGKFVIKQMDNGNYKIVISFIGYQSKSIAVTLVEGNNDIELGTINISTTTEVLQEVTIEGQKAVIEERVDRTIYNAENDITAQGGDASDVLRRVPMLSVDLDGNVSLRGNQNIQVLINNKPSTIVASNISDALKQIPADQIKSVEVITSPSAKYDAEGSAGIINIITKKNNLQGLTLSIDAGVGLRGSNLGLNGNYRKKKMGFSLGGWGRANYNVNGEFENEQTTFTENGTILNFQKAATRNQATFGNYTLGWDYDINEKNYMTASIRFGLRNSKRFQDQLITGTYQNDMLTESSLSDITNEDNSNNVDASLTFTHLYKKPQHELSFQTQYSRNNRQNDFINEILESTRSTSDFKNINDSYNEELTFQIDYQQPIKSNQMLELGAKDIVRKVYSEFSSFREEDGFFVPSQGANFNNNLNYDQNIVAGYFSYTYTTTKGYSFKAGSRYEYTTINAYTRTEDNIEIPSYGVLVPSINASKKLKNGNTLKLSYNRRIQRPSIRFLNPNAQFDNNLNVTIGNPSLDPEYTNNYELGYSTFIKGTSINLTAFARNSNDAIQSIREPLDSGAILTTYRNIGSESAYGSSIFTNINIGKFSLNTGGDIYYAVLDNNSPDPTFNASNEGWVVSGRLFGSYNLSKGWAVQFFGFTRGRRVQLQGTEAAFRMYSLGIRKDLNQKRGSIGIGAENFLTPSIKLRSETISPVVTQRSLNTLNNFSVRINFSYRIGKMGINDPQRRKRSINNDDLKEGDNDNFQGGGQPTGGAPSGGRTGPRRNEGNQTQKDSNNKKSDKR